MHNIKFPTRKNKGGKFLKLSLISYVAVSATLILISFLLNYTFFYRQLDQEMQHSQDILLSVFRESMTNQFQNLDEIASLIKNDPDMLPALSDNSYSYYKNSQQLRSYLAVNPHLYDICFYCEKLPHIVSAIGSVTTDEYTNTYFRYLNIPDDDLWNFLKEINQKTLTSFYDVCVYSGRSKNQRAALYVVPISSDRKVIFSLKESFFTNSLEKYFLDNTIGLSIYDSKAQEILSIGQKNELPSAFSSAFDGRSQQVFTHKQKDSLSALVSSYYNNWFYYLVYRIPDYVSMIQLMNAVGLLLLAALIILGGLLSIAASHYTYRPIRSLYQSMLEDGEPPQETNELKYIENYLRAMKVRNAEMSQNHDRAYSLLLNKLMSSVVNGRLSYEENRDVFANTSYALKEKWMCVAVFRTVAEQSTQANQVILHTASLTQSNASAVPVYNDAGGISSIILCASEHAQLHEFAHGFCEQVVATCGAGITFGIGSRYDVTEQLSISYSRALIALATAPNQTQIHFYSQVDSPRIHLEAMAECKQRISTLIQESNMAAIHNYLKSIFCEKNEQNLQMAYYAHIISTLLLLCEQHELHVDNLYEYLMASHFGSQDYLQKALLLAKQLCHCLESSAGHNNQLLHDVMEYMAATAADPLLSSQVVADHFGISLSYLNRYFKEKMEISPTAYIDQQRLMKAARLIGDTELQIKEIVTRVGYVDVNNFIRKFKKTYGKTPLQYRQDARKAYNEI